MLRNLAASRMAVPSTRQNGAGHARQGPRSNARKKSSSPDTGTVGTETSNYAVDDFSG